VAVAEPCRACEALINSAELVGKIVIVQRGDCMFIDKVSAVATLNTAHLVPWPSVIKGD